MTEREYLAQARERIVALKAFLDTQPIPGVEMPEREWLLYLLEMKGILGNTDNIVTVVASFLARDYLARTLPMLPPNAVMKPPGAPGLDIDERTTDGRRVIGEIKTTTPYKGMSLGAQQEATFKKDFAKLTETPADHKFFFVTDLSAFAFVRRKYGTRLPGVTVVLLTTGESFTQ